MTASLFTEVLRTTHYIGDKIKGSKIRFIVILQSTPLISSLFLTPQN